MFNKISLLWLLAISLMAPAISRADGSLSADSYYTNYVTTNVGVTTPVSVVSSVRYPVRGVLIFDSSGIPVKMTITSGPYITVYYIPPGGSDSTLKISKGDSITLLSTSGTINMGINIITLLY